MSSPRFRPNPDAPRETVVGYSDCNACRGHGTVIGGDEARQCPSCVMRFRREYGPFVDALAEIEALFEERDRWAAEDRLDERSKRRTA